MRLAWTCTRTIQAAEGSGGAHNYSAVQIQITYSALEVVVKHLIRMSKTAEEVNMEIQKEVQTDFTYLVRPGLLVFLQPMRLCHKNKVGVITATCRFSGSCYIRMSVPPFQIWKLFLLWICGLMAPTGVSQLHNVANWLWVLIFRTNVTMVQITPV